MRRPIIAANWKLHKTIAEARQFVERLYHHCPDPGEVDVVLAAPFTALAAMHDSMRATPYLLAAQDVFWEDTGGLYRRSVGTAPGGRWLCLRHHWSLGATAVLW